MSGSEVPFASSLTYLGMLIGANLKETVNLAIKNYASKIQAAYASLASKVSYLGRVHRSQLYNSLAVPHLLALAPLRSFLNCGKRKQVHLLYFKFAKYLIELPTWTINSFLQRKYQLVKPAGVIKKSICHFSTEYQKSFHPWSFLFVPCL